MTKDNVISDAIEKCLKELYTLAVPSITWEEFEKECIEYSEKYKKWEYNIQIIKPIKFGGQLFGAKVGKIAVQKVII